MRVLLVIPLVLAACASPSLPRFGAGPEQARAAAGLPDGMPRPPRRSLDPTPAPPPPRAARTAREFDTTTAEDRAEALAVTPAPAEERELGRAVASLGAPTDPGIWAKTPLVSELTMGRIVVAATGKSANIELRPSTGGTQLSLPAMRLLEVPLTDLPEVIFYAR